ncbi:MAG: guanylate kinase [Armatimonadota bacterium]
MTDFSADTAHLQGILFILSGPSGVGKDTVLRAALPQLGNIRRSVSATTRAQRPNERDGEDYFFISTETFVHMMETGELLEHAPVHGKLYGTPRGWVLDQLRAGTDVVLEIDIQGAIQVKTNFPEAILIFLAPPSWEELSRRLHTRNTESEAEIKHRLKTARQEMARADQYEYLIVNDRVEDAAARLQAIVTAERCRPFRQDLRGLVEF